VVEEDDLASAEEALGEAQRSDHVVGDDAAGVADDVRSPLPSPSTEDVDARVHARDHGEVAGRLDLQLEIAEVGGVGPVVLEELAQVGREVLTVERRRVGAVVVIVHAEVSSLTVRSRSATVCRRSSGWRNGWSAWIR
jgi:hypothetical protein